MSFTPETEQAPLRVRLGYRDLDTFIARFAPNVSRGGVFIATKAPRPIDSVFRFEIALSGGPVVLSGEARVTVVREFDPEAPRNPHGMGLQFISIDEATQPFLDRLVEEREGAQRARRRSARPARPRRTSVLGQIPAPVSAAGAENGRIDIGDVDAGVSEESILRAMDYALELGAKDNVESLLGSTPAPTITVESIDTALAGLSRMLRPRTKSGLYRIPAQIRTPDLKNNDGRD